MFTHFLKINTRNKYVIALRKLIKNLTEIKSTKLNIGDRLQQIQETEVFVAVKDHKVGFPFTFISPYWQNLILVNYSKYILDNNKF